MELTVFEKLACSILSKLKYDENSHFYKCKWNSFILLIAQLILGRDSLSFMQQVLYQIEPSHIKDIDFEINNLR